MAEMTHKQIIGMTTAEIATHLRRAAAFQRESRAITWEHGYDIVSIVATHGDRLAEALETFALDLDLVAEQEEHERNAEERRALENAEMDRHFREHPHG